MKITQVQAILIVQRLVAPRYTKRDALAELDSFSDVAYLVPGWGCKLYSRKDKLGRRRFRLEGYAPDGSDVKETLAFIERRKAS